jgi:hypothetical protein
MSNTYKHKQKIELPKFKAIHRPKHEPEIDDDFYYQIGHSITEESNESED